MSDWEVDDLLDGIHVERETQRVSGPPSFRQAYAMLVDVLAQYLHSESRLDAEQELCKLTMHLAPEVLADIDDARARLITVDQIEAGDDINGVITRSNYAGNERSAA